MIRFPFSFVNVSFSITSLHSDKRISFSWCILSLFILNLRRWYFFNHDPRYGIPTSVSTCNIITTLTLAYPEAHTYVAFRNLVTVAFYLTVTKGFACCRCMVNNPLNSRWFCTFCAVKCKIPSITSTTAIRS